MNNATYGITTLPTGLLMQIIIEFADPAYMPDEAALLAVLADAPRNEDGTWNLITLTAWALKTLAEGD